MRNRGLAATAAAFGAACLLAVPLATGAGAQTDGVTVYQSEGTGQGIGLQFAVTPSIFDPLVDVALLHGSSSITSQAAGQAYALAASVYPGTLAIGGAGCPGVPGSPWVQGTYPPVEGCPQEQEASLARNRPSTFNPQFDAVANQVLERAIYRKGHVRAFADLGESRSMTRVSNAALLTEPNGDAIVEIGTLEIETIGLARPDVVGHEVRVDVSNLSLLGGIVRIASLGSSASTNSDGTVASADGTLTFSGVTVEANGNTYEASITNEGIIITEPDLSQRQRLGVQEEIQESLFNAGLLLSVGDPIEIVDGTRAEATVGGLIIGIRGSIPAVAIPDALAPVVGEVISNIPTMCAYDFGIDALPICFGAGVLPGPGSAIRATISIGSAAAATVGDALTFDFGGPIDGGGDVGGGPAFPEGPFTDTGPFLPTGPQEQPAPPTTEPQQPQPQQPQQLVGLVANLPSAGLVVAGALLLVLALGLALGPSLRHAGTR